MFGLQAPSTGPGSVEKRLGVKNRSRGQGPSPSPSTSPSTDLRRREKSQGGCFSLFSASGGLQRAPGAPKDDSGRETGPGEGVGTSGDRVLKKTRHRMSGSTSKGLPSLRLQGAGADPDIRCRDLFNTRSPEVPTPSLGPVCHPGHFFDGPGCGATEKILM